MSSGNGGNERPVSKKNRSCSGWRRRNVVKRRRNEEKKRADEGWVAEEVRERVEEEQVAEGQQDTTDVGGEGSKETETTAGVTAGESWETDIARLHVATMAGGDEEYQATEDTCWNCRHRKLVCECPE